MTWTPPEWLNAEDRALENEMVESLRAVVNAARAQVERADTGSELLGWRMRVTCVIQEAKQNVSLLERGKTA